jgi:HEAT repeat protein
MNGKTIKHVAIALLFAASAFVFVNPTPARAQEAVDEAAFINVLKSDASWLEKQTVCRALRVRGTEASVPALAALLPDEKLSQLARFALEGMQYPEAGKALRDAIAVTEGAPRMGVIISLGARRDQEAAPLIIPFLLDKSLRDGDAIALDTAKAAAGALGRIASPIAVSALLDARRYAPKSVIPAVAEGLLAAGDYLTREDKGEKAAAIYEELLKSRWAEYVQAGAFHGLAFAEPDKAPKRVADALDGKDPLFRDIASRIVAETSGEETTLFYSNLLKKLPEGGQSALLRGLASRKDPAARPAVVAVLTHAKPEGELAVVKALSALGNAQDVPALAKRAGSTDDALAKAASATLVALQGDDVTAAIESAFPVSSAASRAKLLDILSTRRSEKTAQLAESVINDEDAALRTAGLRALVSVGAKEQVPAVIAALAKIADAGERTAAEKALGAMCSRSSADTEPLLLDALNGAGTGTKIALLRTLARLGGPKALDAVLAGISDADADASGESVRLLADWETLDAAPRLLELAKGEDLTQQVLALRGYVRLAGTEQSVEQRSKMLADAMTLVRRPDEKKLVVGAYGAMPTQESLDVLRSCFEDAAVQNEAASGIIAVASELGKNADLKPKAIEALKAVIEKAADPGIRDNASKALAGLQ